MVDVIAVIARSIHRVRIGCTQSTLLPCVRGVGGDSVDEGVGVRGAGGGMSSEAAGHEDRSVASVAYQASRCRRGDCSLREPQAMRSINHSAQLRV